MSYWEFNKDYFLLNERDQELAIHARREFIERYNREGTELKEGQTIRRNEKTDDFEDITIRGADRFSSDDDPFKFDHTNIEMGDC